MPLTPRFHLDQTTETVRLQAYFEHSFRVSVESMEVVVDCSSATVQISAPPYALSLCFSPHQFLEEKDDKPAQYDPIKSTLTVVLEKDPPGVDWPNLEFTGKWLVQEDVSLPADMRKKSTWLKAVVDGASTGKQLEDLDSAVYSENALPIDFKNGHCGYGWNGMFHGIFQDYARSGLAVEMLQLENPETTTASERATQRAEREWEDFEPQRYIGDNHRVITEGQVNKGDEDSDDDPTISSAMSFVPHWRSQRMQEPANASLSEQMAKLDINAGDDTQDKSTLALGYFSDKEKQALATIPYPLLPLLPQSTTASPSTDEAIHQRKAIECGLVDLLFAYAYDHRMTCGEPTVESAWTVSILSSSLSWLDSTTMTEVEQVVLSSLRRSLIYPYWRNVEFVVLYIWKDVADILEQGTHCVLRCLLQLRSILEHSDIYYLGNKLFIDPYLKWLQSHEDEDSATVWQQAVAIRIKDMVESGGGIRLRFFCGLQLEGFEQEVVGTNKGQDSEEGESSSSDDDTSSSASDGSSSSGIEESHAANTADNAQSLDDWVADSQGQGMGLLPTETETHELQLGQEPPGRPLVEEVPDSLC